MNHLVSDIWPDFYIAGNCSDAHIYCMVWITQFGHMVWIYHHGHMVWIFALLLVTFMIWLKVSYVSSWKMYVEKPEWFEHIFVNINC